MNYGGSGVERVVIDQIERMAAPGALVGEVGAGLVSTVVLSEMYDLYTLEQNLEYVDVALKAHYLYCPLQGDGWYDPKPVEGSRFCEATTYLIDGPSCGGRLGMLGHLDLFNPEAGYVFHDSNRVEVIELANGVSRWCGREVRFFTEGDFYAVIPGVAL